jgi:hypothetical protein
MGVPPNISELLGIPDGISKNNNSYIQVKYPISIKVYDMNVSNLVSNSNEKSMNDREDTIYNYSISFWFNIDTNTPNSGIAYSLYTPILTYGTTPVIMYNYLEQSMIIASTTGNLSYPLLDTTKINDPNEIYKNLKLKIIYETKNIRLQKWNNIVVVYSSSIVDIFINGELVKSNISLSPTKKIGNNNNPEFISLKAGYTNGINGKICNIIYYNQKIGLEQIQRLYNLVKNNNPPIFYPSIL